MSSLFAMLSQQTPHLQTRKGLIILGLQTDFLSPDGKLPVENSAFLDRIAELVPAFREYGDVIWVRSEFESTRPVNGADTTGDTVIAGNDWIQDASLSGSERRSKKGKGQAHSTNRKHEPSASFSGPDLGENDEELFLTATSTREPCCVRGTDGAEYADRVKPLIQHGKDLEVTKTHYSAFGSTSLLLTLRSRLITDLFVCGCMTNLSVYATAMDAARYGIDITLVSDCLGYRRKDRHETAVLQLSELMAVEMMPGALVIERLRNPDPAPHGISDNDGDDESDGSECRRYDDEDFDMLEAERGGPGEGNLSSPTVRRSTSLLDRKLERHQATRSGKYSHAAAKQERPRAPAAEHAESSRLQSNPQQRRRRPVHPTAYGQRYEHLQSQLDRSSSRRELAKFESLRKLQPWLDIIPQNRRVALSPSPDSHLQRATTPPRHPGLAAFCAMGGIPPNEFTKYQDEMRRAQQEEDEAHALYIQSKPVFGFGKELESAGSSIIHNFLPPGLVNRVFDDLYDEVNWSTMYHQTGEVPRLVSCQGTLEEDGSMPCYRHPSDYTLPAQPWTATVDRVRKAAEEVVGHPLNHALIQLYRGGADFISEHSDKTLDITAGSKIVNVSFGACRTMRLRTKRCAAEKGGSAGAGGGSAGKKDGDTLLLPRTTHHIPMPHNSMITMSLETNAEYLHGIKADKRPACELNEAEKAYGGQRISLTFRNIGTYLDTSSTRIWGQGAVGKNTDSARPVVNGDANASEQLIHAFGKENAASSIEWELIYGQGFDVLHLK